MIFWSLQKIITYYKMRKHIDPMSLWSLMDAYVYDEQRDNTYPWTVNELFGSDK